MTTPQRTKHKSTRRQTEKKARQGQTRKKAASEIKRRSKPPRPPHDLPESVPTAKGPQPFAPETLGETVTSATSAEESQHIQEAESQAASAREPDQLADAVADEAANPEDNSPAIDDVVHHPVNPRPVVSTPEAPAATKNTGMGTGDILEPLLRLTPESNFDDVNVAVREFAKELATLPPVERVLFRHQAIKILAKTRLAAGARLMDAALEEVKDSAAGGGELVEGESPSAGVFPDVVPWPEQVNGPALMSEVESFVRTHVVLADRSAYVPFVLWAVAAHAHDFFRLFPILVLSSPTKRSGKTTGLTVMSVLAPKPMFTSNTTAAALFYSIDAHHPTVLIDEADTFMLGDEALRGVLNSSHIRDLAYIMRKGGRFSTWAAMILAAIGRVPGTIEDRSIIILMVRRAPGEKIERLRSDRLHEHEHLRRKIARWVRDHAEEIKEADPHVPLEISSDRARDNWRVLFAIADVIGGEWPDRAREAAIQLSRSDEEFEDDLDSTLLRDLQTIFLQEQAERLDRREIIRRLVALEDRPWADYRRGRPLTVRDLGKILKRFRVQPQKWAVQELTGRTWQRGYFLADLADSFARYAPISAPPHSVAAEAEQPQAPHVPQPKPQKRNPIAEPKQTPEPPKAPPTPQAERKAKRLIPGLKPKREPTETPPAPPRKPGRHPIIPDLLRRTT